MSSVIAEPVELTRQAARDRAQYLAVAAVSGAVLALARLLQPSPRGVGTHEQLGLPPCTFLQLTGIPCPSCGLTTSFAHAAHGHFYEAFVTQPFGFIAFWVTVLLVPLSLYALRVRAPWQQVVGARLTKRFVAVLLVLYLLGWVYKIIVMT